MAVFLLFRSFDDDLLPVSWSWWSRFLRTFLTLGFLAGNCWSSFSGIVSVIHISLCFSTSISSNNECWSSPSWEPLSSRLISGSILSRMSLCCDASSTLQGTNAAVQLSHSFLISSNDSACLAHILRNDASFCRHIIRNCMQTSSVFWHWSHMNTRRKESTITWIKEIIFNMESGIWS